CASFCWQLVTSRGARISSVSEPVRTPPTTSCSSPAAPTACALSVGPHASPPSKPASPTLSDPPLDLPLPLSRLRRLRSRPRIRRLPRLLPGQALPRGLPPLSRVRPPPAAPAAEGPGDDVRGLPHPRPEVAALRRAAVAGHGRPVLRRAE